MDQSTLNLLEELADLTQIEHGFNSPVYVRLRELINGAVVNIPDRTPVWAFEVDGEFVRWCGTLEQFEKDCNEYVFASIGNWTRHSKYHVSFQDTDTKLTTHFKAVKN
jgi:hypothetical protein